MKKNKKVTPVNETINEGYGKGTVGEFIALLSEFPKDSKFKLNGNVDINEATYDDNGELMDVTIYPKQTTPQNTECINQEDCVKEETYEDKVLDGYFFGLAATNPEVIIDMRAMNGNALTEASVMIPSSEELNYESQLLPYQQDMIDQIRRNNIYVAECCAELHRREVAALLEYQTQCIARFGVESNRDMCVIVDCNKFED